MMSPHDHPWLDDFEARQRAELQARWNQEANVFNIQNQAMKTVLRECPNPMRKPEDCATCGNEACINAWKEQNKLWGQPEDLRSPVSVACTINTRPAAAISPVKSESPATTKCPAPGQPASGSSLFDPPEDRGQDD